MKLRPTKRRGGAPGLAMVEGLLDALGIPATPENVAAVLGKIQQKNGDYSKIHTPELQALLAKLSAEDDA